MSRPDPRAIPAELAARVRLVILDVDGVLTDNGVYIGAADPRGDGAPVELKRFDIRDGLGIRLLLGAGIAVELLSGRPSPATAARAAELGVTAHQTEGGHKLATAERILAGHGLDWPAVAVVGDDLADLPLLRRAGLPVTVADAAPEVLAIAGWRTSAPGGRGAVREFAEALLAARGELADAVADYERARTRSPREVSRAG